VPRFEPEECWFDTPQGQTVDCGYLVVPEDRAKQDDKTIKLAVARFKSSSSNAASDPIVYLEGGPGGSPLRGLIEQFNVIFGPWLEKRDLILFDQRGTGFSQPALDCPEYKDWAISVLPENLSTAQAEEQGNKVLTECRNRLASTGVTLAAFNSAENAADLNDLRVALGIDQWNLYGVSYGTRLALTAMRDFPDGIRGVVIDSVVPLQSNLYSEIPTSGARAFDELFGACAADSTCNGAFPNLRDVFFDLVEQFNREPVTFPVKLKSGERVDALMNGDGLISFTFQTLYATSLIPLLPGMIYDLRDGNYALAGVLQGEFLGQLDDISYGMHYSVQCDEEVPFGTPADIDAAVKQNPEFSALGGKGVFDLCTAWNVPGAAAVENQPVASDIPTLVLSGQFDPITPPDWGELAAQTLSESFFFELPNSGHGASLTGGDCPRSIVLAFLDNPTASPDVSCIEADMSKLSFALPLDVSTLELEPFTEDSMGFSGAAPTSWGQAGPGVRTPSGTLQDQTALLQQAVPLAADQFRGLLDTQFAQFGVEAKLEEAGSRTANGLDWTLYATTAQISAIDVALAERSGTTYVVMLQSVVGQRDALYDGVFLPAVDGLKPSR